MGLLDDAIREHLDLKRRRGADPAEVERAERDALGPVRRGPEEPLMATAEEDRPAAYDHVEDGAGWDEFAERQAAGSHELAEDEEFHEYEEYDEYSEPPHASAQIDLVEPSLPAEPLTPEEPLPPHPEPDALVFTDEVAPFTEPELDRPPLPHRAPADGVDQSEPPRRLPSRDSLGETVEYDVEGAMEAESGKPAKREDDVLEETPEFLQDTPDHDRLWFEQRPPRDFDFNG